MSNISPLFAVEAEELLKSGRAQEAIDLCKLGIEAFPNYTIAYGILARAHSAIGDTAVAESVLENAAQHFPRSKTIRKIVDLSNSGDINQILNEFEETLEKQTKAKTQTQKKKSKVQKSESVKISKESDVINELIEDIENERFTQKNYQEKIFTQAEISDLKLIFTSDKIDAYVLPFKANFVDKQKRAAHFSQDNFMFPPLFFDIKLNPESITSPILNSIEEKDELEKEMFFDDAIATFNTSLSMDNECEELEAKGDFGNVDCTDTIEKIEGSEIELKNIQQNEEYLTDSNIVEEDKIFEADNSTENNFDELVSNLENEIHSLPRNESESSDDATQNLVNDISELDIFDQVESPILEDNNIVIDKYAQDVDIMAMIEELENPQSQIQNIKADNHYEPNLEDIQEQELLAEFLAKPEEVKETIYVKESSFELDEKAIEFQEEATDELNSAENEDLVGDIIGQIINDNTPRNMSIEQIGNQLNNFESDELEEVEEENYSDFASETIAEIFAEQGAYTNAIKMYTKLIDQEPEKAEYFLSRIEEIKILKNQ